MKKYLAVARIAFKTQLIYRFDVAMTALGTALRIVFAVTLWSAIYETRDQVAGLGFSAMLTYYVLASLLKSLDLSDSLLEEVSDRVRGGTFSKYMTIPDNPQAHFAAQTLGAAGYYALFAALAAVICAVAFRIELAFSSDPALIACGLLMALLGLSFMISYKFLIGVLAFRFGDTGFFRHVQGMLLDFATGAIVPLALLPQGAQTALWFLPFPHVLYTPAMLLSGRMNLHEGLMGLGMLALWTGFMAVLAQATYGRMRVLYDGVGV